MRDGDRPHDDDADQRPGDASESAAQRRAVVRPQHEGGRHRHPVAAVEAELGGDGEREAHREGETGRVPEGRGTRAGGVEQGLEDLGRRASAPQRRSAHHGEVGIEECRRLVHLAGDGGDPDRRQRVVEGGGQPQVVGGLRSPRGPQVGRPGQGEGQLVHGFRREGTEPGGAGVLATAEGHELQAHPVGPVEQTAQPLAGRTGRR